jgi:hypothetical protein
MQHLIAWIRSRFRYSIVTRVLALEELICDGNLFVDVEHRRHAPAPNPDVDQPTTLRDGCISDLFRVGATVLQHLTIPTAPLVKTVFNQREARLRIPHVFRPNSSPV